MFDILLVMEGLVLLMELKTELEDSVDVINGNTRAGAIMYPIVPIRFRVCSAGADASSHKSIHNKCVAANIRNYCHYIVFDF